MNKDNSTNLVKLINEYKENGLQDQIDFDKFYLYSIIVHSTAIEGSTVTEEEAQTLFEYGITSNKRTITEQNMNIDLKEAYMFGIDLIKEHKDITIDDLKKLSSKVMARTGSEYNMASGVFDSSKGDLRKCNVTAGFNGRSYMSYTKVPDKLEEFCNELNDRRKNVDKKSISDIYEISFWAHLKLVTIHPWVDGNGRMARLLMNLLQKEHGLLPTKILNEDKTDYINALKQAQETEDDEVFTNYMAELHCQHMKEDIIRFIESTERG